MCTQTIQFLVDRSPWPIRDGVSVVTANTIRTVAADRRYDVYVTLWGGREVEDQVKEMREYTSSSTIEITSPIKCHTSSSLERLIRYVRGARATYVPEIDVVPREIREACFDVVWAVPISSVGVLYYSKLGERRQRIVADVSDLYWLNLKARKENKPWDDSSDVRGSIAGVYYSLRYRCEQRYECRYLNVSDVVAVQSEVEREALCRECTDDNGTNVIVAANGVPRQLFDAQVSAKRTEFGFLANYRGEYRSRVRWLVGDVWPAVRARSPEARLRLFGQGATGEFREFVESTDGVEYYGYVDSIREVFAEICSIIAPIYKGYGRINKVAEALAAGRLVIGDESAFNGISGCIHKETCLVAETREDWVKQITAVANGDVDWQTIGQEGRKLVRDCTWARRTARILKGLSNDASGL